MKIVRKIMKWLGIGIGALLVLIILASLIMNVIFGRELRQTLAKLKAEGRPLTVAEIRPAPIPDDQNAAPLFEKAARLMKKGTPTKPTPPAAPAIKELNDLIFSNSAGIASSNRYATVIATWPAAQRDALPRLIQSPEMQSLFSIAHEAAQKPGYNNNLKYEDGPNMLLPNLSDIRAMIRFLIIKAQLAAQTGNTEEAWATVMEGVKLTNLLRQEPIMVTQMVRIACNILMIDCLERMADKTDVPTDQARALIAELAQHTDAAPWIRTMDGERVGMGLWCFQTIRDGPQNIMRGIAVPPLLCWVWKHPASGLLKKDLARYLQLLSQMQDYYKVPYYQVAANIRENPLPPHELPYILTGLLLPNLEKIVTTKAGSDATIEVARVGLGLKLFKQKNGAYPDTLDKLAPEFLENIPVDPFTGKALIYRKVDTGFILYSLGPNQQDDNGTPLAPKWDYKVPYDIVWKCAR